MGSFNGVLYQKMTLFDGSFWVSVSALFLALFGFISRIFSKFGGDDVSPINNPDCLAVVPHENNRLDTACMEPEDEPEEPRSDVIELFEDIGEEEKESPNLFFKFEFQTKTYEEFTRRYSGSGDDISSGSVPPSSANKYEFIYGKDLSGFMEKPEHFSVKELKSDSVHRCFGNEETVHKGNSSDEDLLPQNMEAKVVHGEVPESSVDSLCKEEVSMETEPGDVAGDSLSGKNNSPSDQEILEEVQFLAEKNFSVMDSDLDSIASSHVFTSPFIGSSSDGFLSDEDSDEGFEQNTLMDIDMKKVESTLQDLDLEDIQEADDIDEEDSVLMEELQKLEKSHAESSSIQDSEILSRYDLPNNSCEQVENDGKGNGSTGNPSESKGSSSNNPSASDAEDPNKLETLWEHQDLIEQLKMELKKVRAIGLPTILEESESPKIMEDLKPWKIDEKFQHEDTMGELHKFYKSYRERMRKFDILNYQKMYAIGFLQSKDPFQSISSSKSSSSPAITSLFTQNFLMGKRKKSEFDPMMKFISELHSDLEMVYVGQLCLSWEILHWEYEKALELWESDPYGIHRYNEVAGEFQQFQVLVQRFIENEPFEGPRVQNYVKNRCILRNLLQVPVIREDSIKGKKKVKRKAGEDDAITSDMLVEIMEESIRIFWRFVRADKDTSVPVQKSRRGTQVEPQGPADLELFAEVKATLQKKEKKLKDMLRSGNCILRKFQKQQEDGSDQVLYFFSQVDMKLVARVLNMSKITADQLLWCHNKLSKVNFVNRKIHVEQSFSLFPC